jgi:hypothetical protein
MITLTIKKSYLPTKKFTAYFTDSKTGKTKRTHFGAKNYDNYTIHKDKNRRINYRKRHKNDRINNPYTPGSLSYFLLWGKSTSLNVNIKTFKKKFRFK